MPVTRILVTNDGKVIAEGIGYIGKQCLKDLEKLKEALKQYGIEVKVETQQLKPEAHVEVTTYEAIQQ